MEIEPQRLIEAVDEAVAAVLPPPGAAPAGHTWSAAARRTADALRSVPHEVWAEALAEWPAFGFFVSAVVKRILERQAPEAAALLRAGLVDHASAASWTYRVVKDSAFVSAFALGYVYGRQARPAADPSHE